MSNQPAELESWAELASRIRENLHLKKAAMARLVEVHVDTISRWEEGKTTPPNSAVVKTFAEKTGVDVGYALRVARLMPDGVVHAGQPPERDEPAIELIKKSSLPAHTKAELIDDIRAQTEEAREQRRAWAEKIVRLMGRPGLNRP